VSRLLAWATEPVEMGRWHLILLWIMVFFCAGHQVAFDAPLLIRFFGG
jgi:hypothetical protein